MTLKKKPWFMRGEASALDLNKQDEEEILADCDNLNTRHVGRPKCQPDEDIFKEFEQIINDDNFAELKIRRRDILEAIPKGKAKISGEQSKLSLADEYKKYTELDELETECSEEEKLILDELRGVLSDLDAMFHTGYVPIRKLAEPKVLFDTSTSDPKIVGQGVGLLADLTLPSASLGRKRKMQMREFKGTSERNKSERQKTKKHFGHIIEKSKNKKRKIE